MCVAHRDRRCAADSGNLDRSRAVGIRAVSKTPVIVVAPALNRSVRDQRAGMKRSRDERLYAAAEADDLDRSCARGVGAIAQYAVRVVAPALCASVGERGTSA